MARGALDIDDDARPRESAARRSPTVGQGLSGLLLLGLLGAGLAFDRGAVLIFIVALAQFAFLFTSLWRASLLLASAPRPPRAVPPAEWPRYTLLAALHDEAEVTPQLIARLSAIDYPEDRLEGFLVLEAHDHETIDAALRTPRPDWLRVLIAPPGQPRTKPRALNIALRQATGEHLVIYDAEDDPDPLQLREAAARFAADSTGRLACLQAPLRIRVHPRSGFLARQFAAEYAVLFEVALPGMARLGLPFPLGGTSNHFRVDILRRLGGWDAWNVTEDADLGFRFWSDGWRLGVLGRPTYESPPDDLHAWLPQRTRWLKGYMQTWGVHTRRPWRLGPRGLLALVMTLGLALASAAIHAPSVVWLLATLISAADAALPPAAPLTAMGVLSLGAVMAWLSCAVGARRARLPYRLLDMLQAPFYWSLLSLAFVHAVWRLATEPFVWDKTRHSPDPPQPEPVEAPTDAARLLAPTVSHSP